MHCKGIELFDRREMSIFEISRRFFTYENVQFQFAQPRILATQYCGMTQPLPLT
jgi:hypothetical protein